ncbi:MAG TPA: hypothetical protein VJ302_36320 [Blastocatellia bacterium]|nr:hypothetical protein [Blastocatellia bacterium]
MKIDKQENLIQRYLLGELAEADQTALEQELLTDRERFDQVWAFENELIDSYARGEMSRAERERFERRYLTSSLHRERVAIAKSLLTKIDQAPEEMVPAVTAAEPAVPWWSRISALQWWPSPAWGAALAAALLLVFGAIWGTIERTRLAEQVARLRSEAQTERTAVVQREQELARRNQELERELADGRQRSEQLKAELDQLQRRSQLTPSPMLSLLLVPASIRSENAPFPPTIPFFQGKVQLLMELGDHDYRRYQAKVQTAEGQDVLRRDASLIQLSQGRAFGVLTVKAGELATGDYILILFGQTADGRSEEVDRYFFQVS